MHQRINRAVAVVVVFTFIACVTTVASAQSGATDELARAVSAQDIAKVDAILTERPELASASIGGVSILLSAVFAKGPGAPFIRPEENDLVAAFLTRNPELGVHEAAVLGRLNRLRELVREDPSRVHQVAPSDWTPVHFAAFSGNVACVRLLIEMGADIHRRAMRSSKITPLQSAMFTRRFEVVQLLLEHGADPLVRARGGFSAMHEAALLNDTRLVQLLFDHGAELNSRTDMGKTPLDTAHRKNSETAAALLHDLGGRTAREIDSEQGS